MFLMVILISRTIIMYLLILYYIHFYMKKVDNKFIILDKVLGIVYILFMVNSITNYDKNILIFIIPILTFMLLRQVFNIIYEEKRIIKNYFDKDPVMLVQNSKINFKNLVKYKYSLNKLLNELRKNNIYDLKDCKYVVLEDNKLVILNDINNRGQISCEPIILNSEVNNNILKSINMKKKTLIKILNDEKLVLDDIYFAIYRNKKLYIIRKKELN